MATKKNWIADAIEKPGALRKTLKMKKDEEAMKVYDCT